MFTNEKFATGSLRCRCWDILDETRMSKSELVSVLLNLAEEFRQKSLEENPQENVQQNPEQKTAG